MKRLFLRRVTPASGVVFAVMSAVFAMPSAAGAAEDTLKWAAQDFRSYCASCHGVNGGGDGPVAEVLKVRPADLTRIALRNGGAFPVEAVYKKIEGLDMPPAHGTKQMPVWGIWFAYQAIGDSLLTGDTKPTDEKVAERIRGIVAYLETIQQ